MLSPAFPIFQTAKLIEGNTEISAIEYKALKQLAKDNPQAQSLIDQAMSDDKIARFEIAEINSQLSDLEMTEVKSDLKLEVK